MLRCSRSYTWMLLMLATVCACTPFGLEDEERKTPLSPVVMHPDSVALDIVSVRTPFGDAEINGPMWMHIDEQSLPLETRQQLAKHGFRAGTVGGRIPEKLQQIMQLEEQAPDATQDQIVSGSEESPVVRRHLQTRKGQRGEILASGVQEEMSVLMPGEEGLVGKSYSKGQGVFSLRVVPLGDGRIQLRLLPEIHHGEATQRVVYGQGQVRLEPGRAREIFDKLEVETHIAPGQWVVVTCLADRPGSLGHAFFSDESSGRKQQKLLLIRLAQTQYDDRFQADELLPLAEPLE